jgi:antitoxin MazE
MTSPTTVKIAIRRMGNSQGVIIPKPVLAQVGLTDEAEMVVEKGAIVLRKPAGIPRAGWAEASKRIAQGTGEEPAWPEFPNEGDKDLRW